MTLVWSVEINRRHRTSANADQSEIAKRCPGTVTSSSTAVDNASIGIPKTPAKVHHRSPKSFSDPLGVPNDESKKLFSDKNREPLRCLLRLIAQRPSPQTLKTGISIDRPHRIMTLSTLMSECKQRDMRWFAIANSQRNPSAPSRRFGFPL
jgi:hypothetical protein